MRKYMVGAICGSLLTFSIGAFADGMIGKQVDSTYPLYVNGKQAAKNVIVIEGTSYLPVRAAGEMFGYTVSFENNTVKLSNQPKGYYYIHSDLFQVHDVGNKHKYYTENGNDYIPLSMFGMDVLGGPGNYSVVIPGVGSTTDMKKYPDNIYVNLASLGLKVQVIDSDNIQIVKK